MTGIRKTLKKHCQNHFKIPFENFPSLCWARPCWSFVCHILHVRSIEFLDLNDRILAERLVLLLHQTSPLMGLLRIFCLESPSSPASRSSVSSWCIMIRHFLEKCWKDESARSETEFNSINCNSVRLLKTSDLPCDIPCCCFLRT